LVGESIIKEKQRRKNKQLLSFISMRSLVFALFWLLVEAGERSQDHLKVTCGSAIKLTHTQTGYKLHSHDIKYGSGSGQQVGSGLLLINGFILHL
jgi:hypothetical protein